MYQNTIVSGFLSLTIMLFNTGCISSLEFSKKDNSPNMKVVKRNKIKTTKKDSRSRHLGNKNSNILKKRDNISKKNNLLKKVPAQSKML